MNKFIRYLFDMKVNHHSVILYQKLHVKEWQTKSEYKPFKYQGHR